MAEGIIEINFVREDQEDQEHLENRENVVAESVAPKKFVADNIQEVFMTQIMTQFRDQYDEKMGPFHQQEARDEIRKAEGIRLEEQERLAFQNRRLDFVHKIEQEEKKHLKISLEPIVRAELKTELRDSVAKEQVLETITELFGFLAKQNNAILAQNKTILTQNELIFENQGTTNSHCAAILKKQEITVSQCASMIEYHEESKKYAELLNDIVLNQGSRGLGDERLQKRAKIDSSPSAVKSSPATIVVPKKK